MKLFLMLFLFSCGKEKIYHKHVGHDILIGSLYYNYSNTYAQGCYYGWVDDNCVIVKNWEAVECFSYNKLTKEKKYRGCNE